MNIVEEKWADIIEYLRTEHELSNVSFTTWIQPLKVYNVIDDTVYIMVNMKYVICQLRPTKKEKTNLFLKKPV